MKKVIKILTVLFAVIAFMLLAPCAVSAKETEVLNAEPSLQNTRYTVSQEGDLYRIGDAVGSDLSALIEKEVSDGGSIFFDRVTIDSVLYLKGNYTLSGTFNSSGGIVSEGERIIINELHLTLNGSPIRIKSGTLTMLSGVINADCCAVRLDYSSSSEFIFEGGEISCSSDEPGIDLSVGAVRLNGGKVMSDRAAAVRSSSELSVSGTSVVVGGTVGIETTQPIHLFGDSSAFEGTLSVRYLSEFPEGSFTPVFYGAQKEHIERISLLDVDHRPCVIEYFESSPFSTESCFIAVSKPFRAVFYIGDEKYYSTEYVYGGAPDMPPERVKRGYSFEGWYADQDLENKFSFTEGITGNLELYGKEVLSAPDFEISSLKFTYDGERHRLEFTRIEHPLMDGGCLSYDWYKDGEALGISSPYLDLTGTRDSGTYLCKITFSYGGDYVTATAGGIEVKIDKKTVTPPTVPTFTYTGDYVSPPGFDNSIYKSEFAGAINVGTYAITLTLKDKENYAWEGSAEASIKVDLKIEKGVNKILDVSADNIYETDTPRVNAEVLFGGYTVLYSSDGISFTDSLPTGVGRVYYKCVSSDSENYRGEVSEILSFEILPLVCVGIRIESLPSKLSYYPFETPDLEGLVLVATMNSGKTLRVPKGDITVGYKNGEYICGGDRSVTLMYSGCSVPLPIEVKKLEYDMSGVIFNDATVTYNGSFITLTPEVNVVGKDGSVPTYSIDGGGVNAGIYEVTVSFSSESRSYSAPESIRATLTIEPLTVRIEYADTEFVYDGNRKVPSAKYKNAGGVYVSLKLSGEGVDAGDYTAYAKDADSNYRFENPNVNYRILKADFDIDAFVWSESDFTYDGGVHRVYLTDLPSGIRVNGYVDASANGTGKYKAVASLDYDEKNYNSPPKVELAWEILPAEYDMTSFGFIDTEVVYDGNMHYPKVYGSAPSGIDGSVLEYSFSEGVVNVSESPIKVKVTFKTSSSNYRTPDPVYVTVKVVPKAVVIVWSGSSFEYNGSPYLPSASCPMCEIGVSGYATNAGEYVAKAVSMDPNYSISNPDFPFTIEKAPNEWLIAPGINDIYESGSLKPYGDALYGDIEVSYFKDPELTLACDLPVRYGVYYAVICAPESENYLGISTDALKFEIHEVLPKEIYADIKEEQIAMTPLSSATKISVVYNDGAVKELQLSDIGVEYQNADTFRYGDTYVTLSYQGISDRFAVRVLKAEYDMSKVIWKNTHHVYDGSAKSATLTGLPDGVFVAEYVGNSKTAAGVYSLGAVLSFDADNYLEPKIPIADLVIEKQTVSIEPPPPVIYDGLSHTPSVSENPLYTAKAPTATEAGRYPIEVTLTDPDNYKLREEPFFEILPIELTVKVMSDGKSFHIESGRILPSDELGEEYYTEGGLVYMRIGNPNYRLTVIPSAVSARSNRIWLGIIVFLCAALMCLTVIIIVKYPDRLKRFGDFFKRKLSLSGISVQTQTAPYKTILATDRTYADSMISNTTAKALMERSDDSVITSGNSTATVSLDKISLAFGEGSVIDINLMKEKELVANDAFKVRVVADGIIDKPLIIKANSFELSAVKMIALTGGKAKKVRSRRK